MRIDIPIAWADGAAAQSLRSETARVCDCVRACVCVLVCVYTLYASYKKQERTEKAIKRGNIAGFDASALINV